MIKEGVIKRRDIFVITKVHKVTCDLYSCIKELGLEYVDCVLIHRPNAIILYEKLLELKSQGIVKNVGVSNFNIEQLKKLSFPPYMNQIEVHLRTQKTELVSYCQNNRIIVQAHSINCFDENRMYKATFSWLLKMNIHVVVGTVNHIETNFHTVYDHYISCEDAQKLQDGYLKFPKFK